MLIFLWIAMISAGIYWIMIVIYDKNKCVPEGHQKGATASIAMAPHFLVAYSVLLILSNIFA